MIYGHYWINSFKGTQVSGSMEPQRRGCSKGKSYLNKFLKLDDQTWSKQY